MRSIRVQLVVSLVAGVLLLVGVAGAGLYAYMEEVLEHGLDAALAAKAEMIAAAVHMEDDGQPHLQISDNAASAAARHDGPFYFQIRRADGRLLARVAPPGSGALPFPTLENHRKHFADAVLPDRTIGRITQLSFVAAPDEDEFDARHPSTTRPTESLTLVVAHDLRSVNGPLEILLTGLLFIAAVVSVGILLIVTWSVRRGLRPLTAVSQLADQIGPESMNVRFPARGQLPLELQPIGSKLNDLLNRLQAAFERERGFSAAVAHELRTPLAELRSLCEVTLRWPDDKDATLNALTEGKAIAIEMGAMVQTLLTLARCQAGSEPPQLQTIRLSQVLDSLWSKYSAVAVDRGLKVEADADFDSDIRTDPAILTIVLRNLLENAVQYTSAGGRLRLSTASASGGITLNIANTSDALDPVDLPHLFEPFWRKSASRTGGTHVGLGLTIVDAFCRALGVKIETPCRQGEFDVNLMFVTAAVSEPPNHALMALPM